ncbi:MAG: hypothetical protein Q4D99_07910, partial [Bacillota bacterium]|nr:hypothetical protein [Bacillota bacterium]
MDTKLGLRYKLSYGAAGFGEATSYCLMSTFLLFFLTTIVGIAPALAGTIVAIGSVCEIGALGGAILYYRRIMPQNRPFYRIFDVMQFFILYYWQYS